MAWYPLQDLQAFVPLHTGCDCNQEDEGLCCSEAWLDKILYGV